MGGGLPFMSHDCTCPQCSGSGFLYTRDARKYFKCVTCGLDTLLKLLYLYAPEPVTSAPKQLELFAV